MTLDRPVRVVVITTPERLDQEWIQKLAREPEIERIDRVGVFTSGVDLVQQVRPDVVIFDRELEHAEGGIRQIFTTVPEALCIAVVSNPDIAVMRRLVASGARDVLARPVQYTELMESIRTTLANEAGRRSHTGMVAAAPAPTRGKLVVVVSPKGGVGTTTIATNLAVALRQMSDNNQVVLADFGLQFGDAGVHLNLWSRHTMEDLLAHVEDIDDAMLSRVLQEHKSGVRVLLAPNEPEIAGQVTGERIEGILDRLLERTNYVVADTWSFLDEVSLTLLGRADEVLVVTTPELPTLKNTKHYLEYVQKQGLAKGRITLVLNRFPSVDGISLQDIQEHLRYPIGANIPSEGQLVTQSVNRGIPLVISYPQSWSAQSLMKLAAYVSGDKVSVISLTPDPKGSKGKPAERSERRGLLGFVRRGSN